MKKLIPIVLMAISICTLFGCNKSENSINTEVYETQKIETNKKLQKEYELPADYESTLWLGATEKNHINVLCKTDKGYSLYDLQTQKEFASF